MEYQLSDKYGNLDSLLHRLDPRTKILASVAFVLLVVITPPARWQGYALCFILVASLALLSRLPLTFIVKRSLVIAPFVLVIALFVPFFKPASPGDTVFTSKIWLWNLSVTKSGLLTLFGVVTKAWLSVLSTILLSSTTRFSELLKGLDKLGVPKVMVMTLSFSYRYLFVIVDELTRMRRARDSRNFGGRWRWQMRTIGNIVGTLFIRSFERSERVYQAMAARGYDGEIVTLSHLRLQSIDLYFGCLFISCLVLIGLFSFLIA